ncbi:MAG: serine/threonine-protein kinase [Planctomycetota bacterium]
MPAADDSALLLAAAVEHGMLTPEVARDLRKPIKRSGQPALDFLVERDRLTPIQAEALEGLITPDSVADGYVVEGLLGYGGIGVVYRARKPGLDREVALKTIRVSRVREGGSQSTLGRFEQEARAIARLKHPGIVTAYDYGAKPERLYLAMELVDGEDLEDFIRRHDRVVERTAWQLIRQATAALAHAMEAGVIHRDIKPANLLLCEPPAGYPLPAGVPLLKVTDFGLARLSKTKQPPDSTRLTVAGSTMGTPHYMAPEQIENSSVDHRADIYALGATAWHMVAGEPPLAGLSMMKIFAAKVSGEGVSLDDLPPDVSSASRRLLGDMLRHEPEHRLADYDELLQRIDEAAREPYEGDTVVLPPPAPTPTVTPPVADTPESLDLAPAERATSRTRSRWLARLASVAGLAVVLVGVGLAFINEPSPPLVPGTGESFPLLRANALGDWQNADADLTTGYARVKRNSRRKIADERRRLPQPEHFRLQLRVDLDGADALEVWFEPGRDPETKQPKGEIWAVRVEGGAASLGSRSSDSAEFEPLAESVALSDPQQPVLLIDRDRWRWFVSEQAAGQATPRPIGDVPLGGSPPDEVRFNPVGAEEAKVGDLELIPLVEPRRER